MRMTRPQVHSRPVAVFIYLCCSGYGSPSWPFLFLRECLLKKEARMSTAVLVKNVKKTFGNYNLPNWKNFTRTTGRPALPPRPVTVLDDVSFQVAQGEIFAILGSGGA